LECKLCKIKEGKLKAKIVYEDAIVLAMLSEYPAALGHVEIFSKQHVDTIEALQDIVVQQLFTVANTTASALFEASGAQGTNIVMFNGDNTNNPYPHLVCMVLSRREDDGINFQWKPKQLQPEEMDAVQSKIRDKAFIAEHHEKEKKEPKKAEEHKKQEEEVITIEEENYQVKQLDRLP